MLIYLVLSWGFMPESPWRSLTSTLAYDVTTAVSGVFLHEIFHGSGNNTCDDQSHRVGSHPLGTLRYNPAEDPYYVSNLDKELDPFLAEVLRDVKFTNIVHIVLESMREDSFPYDENGLLHKHILENETPVKGGTPVTSENLTPFINSLAENTLQWHTMWATIPYTHKSMLGCNPLSFSTDSRLVWATLCPRGLDSGEIDGNALSTLFPRGAAVLEHGQQHGRRSHDCLRKQICPNNRQMGERARS
jgi:hypothetical protein